MTAALESWRDLLVDHIFVDLWIHPTATAWIPGVYYALRFTVIDRIKSHLFKMELKTPSSDHIQVRVIIPNKPASQTPLDILRLLNDRLQELRIRGTGSSKLDAVEEIRDIKWYPRHLVQGEFEFAQFLRASGLEVQTESDCVLCGWGSFMKLGD
ncbi:uncharacterized protein BP01DRAFT_384933 [Aspergillus saccharolyticus JOP 1030-1]|uniref:Uncharacterized protein n=1 Tax=Aspergillus saccharolyticus JOP 1030-1 TaxID=1450539 RepID=A0A318Z9A3_9EURO|nr:hypothetical protein BP01DRAFT_384933 [Aspergillus saccharolyticus JOP 1030-1]PYH42987.1 hypothetical protein BP01DRAFT_384933 [Aspergillus saccharolyticus JOP 1030-1]